MINWGRSCADLAHRGAYFFQICQLSNFLHTTVTESSLIFLWEHMIYNWSLPPLPLHPWITCHHTQWEHFLSDTWGELKERLLENILWKLQWSPLVWNMSPTAFWNFVFHYHEGHITYSVQVKNEEYWFQNPTAFI